MEILREFYNTSKTDLVFSRSVNITPKFYRILREACERAGVPYGRSTRDGLVLHDARHTATTHLLESNVSPKTVQEWMGWSDKAFVLYYTPLRNLGNRRARHWKNWPVDVELREISVMISGVTIPQLTTGAFYCFGLRTRVSLSDPVQMAAGVYASTEPPFFIDEWWQKQLGELQVKQILGCSLFLLALTEDPAYESFLASHLQSHYLSLLLQGAGYSSRGVTLAGQNSSQGLRVSSIGTHETYHEPYKVISHAVTAAHLALTPELARGIDCIFADTSKYLRLRKGFNAFLDGIKQNQLHTRLHNFIRAIEAVIKPKQGEGTRTFTYRSQFFAGRKPDDVSLLNELYELRSAAEHLNPMNDSCWLIRRTIVTM